MEQLTSSKLGKASFHSNSKDGQLMAKECSNCCTVALISHANKVMLKILQVRLQQHVNQELSDVHTGFRKGRVTRDQTANIHWIIEKAREFQKSIYFCFTDNAKAFDCVDHNKLENSLKKKQDENTKLPYLSPENPVCIKKQQLEPHMEQVTGSKL